MTDRNKFEEMLERLVNEDRAGAEELFHELVVEKSRDIYESLLEDEEVEETTDEEVDEATDEEVDEATDEDLDESDDEDLDESDDEDLDESDDEEVEEGFFGEGDPTDDMMGDIAMPGDDMDMGGDDMDMGDDDMGMGDEEGDLADEVADLKDELEALKAEFEAMMGDDAGDDMDDDDMGDMPMDMDSEEGDDEDDDDDDDEMEAFEATDDEVEESRAPKSQAEIMREYTDKVSAKMGDNGANTKSPVAGKNDMGGTSANIAKGGESKSAGTQGGLLNPTTKEDNAGNVNVPGAKAATKMAAQPGHGAEKKGKPENADKGAGSPLNGAPKRAK